MPELPYSAGKASRRETADHLAVDQVVIGTAGCVRALAREDAVVIAVIRYRRGAGLVAFRRCLRGQLAERARCLALRGRPIEAILLSRTAHDPLGIDMRPESSGIERGVFVLRLDISETDLDRGQLIAADAAAQNLVEFGRRRRTATRRPCLPAELGRGNRRRR